MHRSVAVAVSLVLVGALAACTGTPATSPTTAGGAGTGGTGAAASFAERPCWNPNYPGVPATNLGPEFRCGELTVPENRAKPSGKTIKVGVAIAKAVSSTPQKEPLLYLNGGPGGTSIVSANAWVKAGLNADRDVVFVDQRGTYHADPALVCPDLDTFLNGLPTLAFFDPTTKSGAEAAVKGCRDKYADAGWDLSAYNTRESAADLADLRVALGIPSWNVYGVSYGTYLALELVRDHPQGIRSVVLDSVVPAQQNLVVGFWTWAALGYQHLFDACDRQPACKAAYPDLRQELTTTVNALEAAPKTATITTPAGPKQVRVDGYAVANALVLPALAPGLVQELPKALHSAASGDVSLVATIVGSGGPVGATSWGLAYGVFCGEEAAYVTPAEALAQSKRALPGFPDSVLTPRVTQAPTLQWDCETWGVPRVTPDPHVPVTTDVPTLVLEGTVDAVTPRENAQAVLPGLSRSQYVEVPGSGHDTVLWQGACVVPLINAFVKDPLAKVDTSCVKGLTDPAFTTS